MHGHVRQRGRVPRANGRAIDPCDSAYSRAGTAYPRIPDHFPGADTGADSITLSNPGADAYSDAGAFDSSYDDANGITVCHAGSDGRPRRYFDAIGNA